MKGKGQQSTIYDVAKYIIDNFGPMSSNEATEVSFLFASNGISVG